MQGNLCRPGQRRHGHPIAQSCLPIDAQLNLGHRQLWLKLQIDDSGDLPHHIAHLFSQSTQLLKVWTSDLDRDGTADTGQHLVHSVRDESTHIGSHAGKSEKCFTDPCDRRRTIGHRLITQLKIHVRDVDARTISITGSTARSHLNPRHIISGLKLFGEKPTGTTGHLQGNSGIQHERIHQ